MIAVTGHSSNRRVLLPVRASWSLMQALVLGVCLSGCSSGLSDYLEPQDPTTGGPAKLTLAEAGISRIYFTDNDGGISLRSEDTVVQITPGGDPAFPLLAPTADRLVYDRRGDRPNVSVIQTDGRNDWIIRVEGGAHSLGWSADGERLLFSTPESPYNLYTTRPDDTDRLEIATSKRPIDAAWSTDGTQIAFTLATSPESPAQIVIADPMGQNARQVTSDLRSKSLPSWSVDDTLISFVSFDPSGGEVYSVSILALDDPMAKVVDVAQEGPLFEGIVPFTRPYWAPFAPIVAFSTIKSATLARIDFVDTRGGERRQVTDGEFGDIMLDWSPRRGWVAFARGIETSWFLVMARITGGASDQFILGPNRWAGYAVDWN